MNPIARQSLRAMLRDGFHMIAVKIGEPESMNICRCIFQSPLQHRHVCELPDAWAMVSIGISADFD